MMEYDSMRVLRFRSENCKMRWQRWKINNSENTMSAQVHENNAWVHEFRQSGRRHGRECADTTIVTSWRKQHGEKMTDRKCVMCTTSTKCWNVIFYNGTSKLAWNRVPSLYASEQKSRGRTTVVSLTCPNIMCLLLISCKHLMLEQVNDEKELRPLLFWPDAHNDGVRFDANFEIS